jgi:hypothetical protein
VTLTLPEPQAVLDLIEMFIGDRPTLREGEGLKLARPPRGTYITYLKGPDGSTEGAIVTDLNASLYLGGELIMMPPQALAEMHTAGQASEAILDGLGEIFNNLRALLNRIAVNPHVTPTEPQLYQVPTPGDDSGWVLAPSHKVEFSGETDFGTGYLTLLGR